MMRRLMRSWRMRRDLRRWSRRMLAQYEEGERLAARREAAIDALDRIEPGTRARVELARRMLFEEE